MKRYRFLLFSLLFFYVFALQGQIHLLALPTFDIERHVASYSSSKYPWNIQMYGERQWAGFEGAPTMGNLIASYHTKRMGAALNLGYEQLGFTRNVRGSSSFLIDFPLSRFSIFKFSIGFGLYAPSYMAKDVVTEYPNPLDIHETTLFPTANFSLTYIFKDFSVGAAFNYLFTGLRHDNLYTRQTSTYDLFTFASYRFPLSSAWDISPMVCYAYREGFGHAFDVGVSFTHTFFGFKIMDRTNECLSLGVILTAIPHFSIGYDYFLPLRKTQSITMFSSHALSLKMSFGTKNKHSPYRKKTKIL